MISELRGHGLMLDDQLNDKEPVIERALELLPHDLIMGRYRRLMRVLCSDSRDSLEILGSMGSILSHSVPRDDGQEGAPAPVRAEL